MGSDIVFRPTRRLGDERNIPLRIDRMGRGLAGLFEARESPEVRKVPALPRFCRLHRAIAAIQELALAVRLLDQRKPTTIARQPGESLDELAFGQGHEDSQAADFVVVDTDVTRPPAASGAPLAFVEDWHEPQGKEVWTVVNILAPLQCSTLRSLIE